MSDNCTVPRGPMSIVLRVLMAGSIVVIAVLLVFRTNQADQSVEAPAGRGPLKEEQSFQGYVVRTYGGEPDPFDRGSFEILHRGARVYADDGDPGEWNKFRIGSLYEDKKTHSLVRIGSDITGDGRPDLVVSEYTGGANCCHRVHVFEIGDQFRYIQTIDALHSDLADFENVDGDPALELPMVDWTFAYWRAGFLESPAPRVVLKYDGSRYAMAPNLMRKPPLSQDEFVQVATEIAASLEAELAEQREPGNRLAQRMLDLIYSGNMEQAWELADLSWPKGDGGKAAFLRDFRSQLATSPFWDELQAMNGRRSLSSLSVEPPHTGVGADSSTAAVMTSQ